MRATPAIATLALVGVLALVGCTGTPALEVTTAPPAAESSTPTPTPTPSITPIVEAEQGSRENPLAPGEFRLLVADSAWTVGADGPTAPGDGYLLLPLHVNIDWESVTRQAVEMGVDINAEGINPVAALSVAFVSAAGQTYTKFDPYFPVDNDWYSIGTVYPPLEAVAGNYAVTVPADQVAGGVWVVKNMDGDAVFISQ